MGVGQDGEVEVVLGLGEFEEWLQVRMVQKYASMCDGVLYEGVRPLLLLFRAVLEHAEELGAALLRCNDPELLPFKGKADDIAHVVHLLVESFPTCIDYDFLSSFALASTEAVNNITIFLLPFAKITSVDYSVECRDCVEAIEKLLLLHPQQCARLQARIEYSAPGLRKLSALKQMFREYAATLREEIDGLAEATVHLDEFANLNSRYRLLRKNLVDLQQDPVLVRGTKLRSSCSSQRDTLNSMLEPYFRVCAQLKSKKRAIKGDGLAPEEMSAINHMSTIMVKNDIYFTIREHMTVKDFLKFLHMISKAAEKNLLSVSKKNQQLLMEAEAAFEEKAFEIVFCDWTKCMEDLSSLEQTPKHQELRAKYLRLHSEYVEVQQAYRSAAAQVEVDVALYYKCTAMAQQLSNELSKCCAMEFGISACLGFSEALPPIPEKLHEIDVAQ